MLILLGIACVTLGMAFESGWLLVAGVVCVLLSEHVGNVLDVQPDPDESEAR